ncbi:MAG: type II toxin-antitoxin system HipA family toxin [Leucobacter sp.]
MRLAVELDGTRVGHLEGGDARSFDFTSTAEGRERFGAGSTVLSVALPLLKELPRHHVGRRRNWFSELLPEGDQYDFLLAQASLRRGDTLGFLARYGRDVAGAVQLWDIEDPTEPRVPELRPVNDREIRRLLEEPLQTPLANDRYRGKTSLAGVQTKIVLARAEGRWQQALGGYPSTHIIKPLVRENPTTIFDEEFGSRVMRRLGLAGHDTRVTEFDGLSALVVERFDRAHGKRVHQEDFNQALGAAGAEKYQEYGGKVSLRRIASTLETFTPRSDLRQFARMVCAAVVLGNLDMHAKNIGLLHGLDRAPRLAPAYDFVPQAHVPGLDGKLALAVNGRYGLAGIDASDLAQEVSTWGMRGADRLVSATLAELSDILESENPLPGAYDRLRADLLDAAYRLSRGEPRGA